MGIRRKIITGFISLAVLLFFSGVISLFELHRLDDETQNLFESGANNMELSHEMLDAIQDQGMAMLEYNLGNPINFDSVYAVNQARFTDALSKASNIVANLSELQPVYAAYAHYNDLALEFAGNGAHKEMSWFRTTYKEAHYKLAAAIKDYMLSSQERLNNKASHLGETAYRAITPGILALGVAIVILLTFLYLIDTYFARPVVGINRSLKGYLTNRIPFQVKVEGRNEVLELKEQIDDLIAANKSRKTE